MLAWIITMVIGVGCVWKVTSKYSTKIKGALAIVDEISDIVESVLNAVEDKKVTKQEVDSILKEVEDLKNLLSK